MRKPNEYRYIIPIAIIAIFNLVFEFWLENGSSDIYDRINSNYPKTLIDFIVISALILIFVFLYSAMKSYYENEINARDEKIRDSSKIIWEKYQDLYNYKINEVIQKVMRNFILNHPYVLAIQIYEYSIKHQNKRVIIKINNQYVYVDEGYDLNSMVQTYFSINRNIFREFNDSIKSLDHGDINKAIQFISDYKTKITSKPFTALNEHDMMIYELIRLAVEKITIDADVEDILPRQIENKLRSFKRAEIVRGILHEDFYLFRNTRNNHKKNRIYITKTIILSGSPHIVLISIDPQMAYVSELRDFKLLCSDFLKFLHNEITINYNDSMEDIENGE